MMRGPRNLLWLLPVMVVLLAPLWWDAAGEFLSPHSEIAGSRAETEKRVQVFVMDDVFLKQHKGGIEEWNIRSRHVSSSDSGETLLLDGVLADLFREGAVLFHIVSKAGRYEQKKQRLGLAGDVQVKHKKGAVLYTQQLYFLDKESRIMTRYPVRMVGDGMKVQGKGFEYDLNSGAYKIGGRVKVDVN